MLVIYCLVRNISVISKAGGGDSANRQWKNGGWVGEERSLCQNTPQFSCVTRLKVRSPYSQRKEPSVVRKKCLHALIKYAYWPAVSFSPYLRTCQFSQRILETGLVSPQVQSTESKISSTDLFIRPTRTSIARGGGFRSWRERKREDRGRCNQFLQQFVSFDWFLPNVHIQRLLILFTVLQ